MLAISISKTQLLAAKNRLKLVENDLKSEKDPKRKLILESEYIKSKERYNKTKLNLVAIITDIKIDEAKAPISNSKRNYIEEAQELLGPAFDTIQRISERPRKIESLRKEIKIYEERILKAKLALANIEEIEKNSELKIVLPDLVDFLSDARFNINDLITELNMKLQSLKNELAFLTKDDESLISASTKLLREFFLSRGKNLAISIAVFVFILWGLSSFKNSLILNLIKKTKIAWLYKPISALYGLFSFFIAFIFGLLSLYILGDWVLVTLTVLVCSAILWGSKSYLIRYLKEGRLILNLGTIKEGELVIFRNIPWKVKSLNFVTILENEYLDSSLIRVEISEVFKMHSRVILKNEEWFPSKVGDYVFLSDGNFGEIRMQTVEQVVVDVKNKGHVYYTTQNYLNLSPVNYSQGFIINEKFQLSLKYSNAIKDLKETLHGILTRNLKNMHFDFSQIAIELDSMTTNSVVVSVKLKFNGEMACRFYEITSLVNTSILECYALNKLESPLIPVTVLTPDTII